MKQPKKERFESIYVVQPCHDFSLLAKHGKQVRFMSTGTEGFEELAHIIRDKLVHFNPATDAIVAVGKVNSCFLAGAVLKELVGETPIWMGLYVSQEGERDYLWERIVL